MARSAVKVRTVKIGPNKYAIVHVIRKPGKRDSKTVLSEIKKRRSK